MRSQDNHVDEERLVLQHIGEILSDYQKYQQMERSNPNAAGIPTAENRWIQRCLVLLSIATLTRKARSNSLFRCGGLDSPRIKFIVTENRIQSYALSFLTDAAGISGKAR